MENTSSAQEFVGAMDTWNNLSSTGLIGQLVDFAGQLGKFAEAAAKLLGLVA